MKNKILCLILIITVVCSIFVISSSAEDDYVFDAGTYRWVDEPSIPTFEISGDVLSFPIISNGQEFSYLAIENNETDMILAVSNDVTFTEATLIYSTSGFSSFSGFEGWNTDYRSFSLLEPLTGSSYVVSWLYGNTSSYLPSTELLSGYYRLKLPIDVNEPTWIGTGNTVWYNMRGRIVTDTSNRALSFYRLGFRYNEILNDEGEYNGFVLEVLINDLNHDEYDGLIPYLEIYSVSYFADEDRFYYGFNDLVLDSFVGIALDGDYEVGSDFASVFNELFEPYDYVYTGNPWFDIVDGVVDALKIDVFGSFSPWDILVTFIGISVFIWLLKLLAGG